MKKVILITSVLFMVMFFSVEAFADPMSGWIYIYTIRPYSSTSGPVLLSVSSTALCGTDTFTINTTAPNGKEMYAAALSAVMTKKLVMLEVSNSTGCTGFGTLLQSISVTNP